MKTELDELIEFYEEEKQFLENCIKQNQEEYEFMHAHYHLQSLYQVNKQLDILYKLKDPNYTRKQELARYIKMYESSIDRYPLKREDSYAGNELKKYKDELWKLNELKIEFPLDEQQINGALFNVIPKSKNRIPKLNS